MSQRNDAVRKGDPGTKWLVLGAVGVLALGIGFLALMSDQLRFADQSAGGRLVALSVLGAGMVGAVVFGPIGRAVAKRILEGVPSGDVDGVLREVDELRLQTEDLRNALAEAQERLDFTERMLAGGKERIPEELH